MNTERSFRVTVDGRSSLVCAIERVLGIERWRISAGEWEITLRRVPKKESEQDQATERKQESL